MAGTRRKYTREFKIEAVKLLESSGRTVQQVEEEMGIGHGVILRWRREFATEGIRAFPGNGNPRDEELARLRKENAELREERDIMRKAVAFFSNHRK